MTDFVSVFFLVIVLMVATAGVSTWYERPMRKWVWFALFEYMLCAVAQQVWSRFIVEGGDALTYMQGGARLATFLDANFGWASRELLAMVLHKKSAFDTVIDTPESNTGAMYALSGFLIFLFRSTVSAQVFIAGLSFFGALSISRAFRDAYPEADPVHLFAATVLFPSIAFWTSTMHKEAVCLIGMGLLFSAWRAVYRRRFRALLFAPLGLLLVLQFRAPALPPVALGLVVYAFFARLQKARGADAVIVGPLYLGVGLGGLALAMLAVSQVMPGLGLNQLGETMAQRQDAWHGQQFAGGSAVVDDEVAMQGADAALSQTFAGQLARLPLGLLNALFRPQFFDVHNIATLIGALEMSILTWLVFRAIKHHGVKGLVVRIQRSPFLLMCTVTTLVGCAFVGLVTLNLGSLARYRVPFLPFYGALVLSLSPFRVAVPAPVGSMRPKKKNGLTRRHATAGPRAAPSGLRRGRSRPPAPAGGQ